MQNKVHLACAPLAGMTGHASGRMLLTRLYRKTTGEELPEIAVTERGKPFFLGSPWHFSISHTRAHVFCALAKCPVGIDAEETERHVRPELAKKILSAEEFVRWEESDDRNRALLRLWVLKEAAAKLTGEGLRGYPNQTNFDPEDPRVQEMSGCYVAVLTEEKTDAV